MSTYAYIPPTDQSNIKPMHGCSIRNKCVNYDVIFEFLYVCLFQEIPRTPDYAPSRTFYLFSVNLLHVARMLVERCYKALGNLITKRMTEMKENKCVCVCVCVKWGGRLIGMSN